jgi:hypothetical protein
MSFFTLADFGEGGGQSEPGMILGQGCAVARTPLGPS